MKVLAELSKNNLIASLRKIEVAYGMWIKAETNKIKVTNNKNTILNNVVSIFQTAAGGIKVNYFTANSTPVTLRITDVNGRIVATAYKKSVSGMNVYDFYNFSPIKTQVLLVQVVTVTEIFTKKIVLL